jgi:hypothetical protein
MNNTAKMDKMTRQGNNILFLVKGERQFILRSSVDTRYLYVRKNIIPMITPMREPSGTIRILQNIIVTRAEKKTPIIPIL